MPPSFAELVLCAAVAAGCSPSEEERGCPPAPFAAGAADACDFAARDCLYAAPRGLTTSPEPCNAQFLWCEDGHLRGIQSLMACRFERFPGCATPVIEGAACERQLDWYGEPSNAECFVPDDGPQLDAARVVGRTCACDFPGPVWRCLRGTFVSP